MPTYEQLRILFPNASPGFLAANSSDGVPAHLRVKSPRKSPVVERASRTRTLAKKKAKKIDPRKFLVRVTSYRRRLLDEDNLAEKWFVDCCRYAGLIPDDSAEHIQIVTTQKKVFAPEDETTEIVIEPMPHTEVTHDYGAVRL